MHLPIAPLALAVAATILGPTTVQAQNQLDTIQIHGTLARADGYDAAATVAAQSGSMAAFSRAAGLHERAARLRAPEDPRGSASLVEAALLRYYVGQRPEAAALMTSAAEQAAARGDPSRAAEAYIDAAFIALELRDVVRARDLAARGVLLSHSPLLSEREKDALRRRVAQGPAALSGLVVARAP